MNHVKIRDESCFTGGSWVPCYLDMPITIAYDKLKIACEFRDWIVTYFIIKSPFDLAGMFGEFN